MAELVSVNVGRPRKIGVSRRGRPVISAIGKVPVAGRVEVRGSNVAGDVVEILSRPDHGITIAMVAWAITSEPALLAHAATAPALPQDLAGWMRERGAAGTARSI